MEGHQFAQVASFRLSYISVGLFSFQNDNSSL